MLYELFEKPIILYVAWVWYTGKGEEANSLLSVQWGIFLCVMKCYSTVSSDALHVLSRVLPLDLRAEMGFHSFCLKREGCWPYTAQPWVRRTLATILPAKTSVEYPVLGNFVLEQRVPTLHTVPRSRTTPSSTSSPLRPVVRASPKSQFRQVMLKSFQPRSTWWKEQLWTHNRVIPVNSTFIQIRYRRFRPSVTWCLDTGRLLRLRIWWSNVQLRFRWTGSNTMLVTSTMSMWISWQNRLMVHMKG